MSDYPASPGYVRGSDTSESAAARWGCSLMEQHAMTLTCSMPNKRPTITDEMRRQAAEKVVALMVKLGLVEADRAEGSVTDIVKATRYERYDGYKIARELERHHWDCDMQIAEELENFSGLLDSIYNEAEKRWAEENPMAPTFESGSTVLWRGEAAVVGGICEHRPHSYKVRQGKMKVGAYYVVPFEDVSAA